MKDYSLLITDLPHGEKFTHLDLKELMINAFRRKGYFLKGINFVYKTEHYTELKQKFWASITKLYKIKYVKESQSVENSALNTSRSSSSELDFFPFGEKQGLLDPNDTKEIEAFKQAQKLE